MSRCAGGIAAISVALSRRKRTSCAASVVSANIPLEGPPQQPSTAKEAATLGKEWEMHERLMDKGFARLSEMEESGLLDQCIAISERALRKVLESADIKFRQLDMDKPKVASILSTPGILEIFGGAGWVEEDYWLVLPEGTPLQLTQRAVQGLQREQRRRATVQSTAENPNERRFNPWDGKVYTYQELEKCLERADLTTAEIQEHWAHRCRPVAEQAEGAAIGGPEITEPQVEAWQKVWKLQSLQRMWTPADLAHVHAISGGAYMALGGAALLDTAVSDVMTLNGSSWAPSLPLEVHYLALFFGVLNALSGLQPSLLGPRRELSKLLGFGRQGDVKSGGFLNAAGFYLVLAYQTLRAVMPELALFDPIVGFITMTLVCHQAYILNRWVASGQMHRVDAFLVPGIFNLPVSLHLAGGSSQVWWENLCSQYAAWPEFFFSGNFAIAWACAMVTLVLSLGERRVISLELRSMLMLALPALVFSTVFLRASVLLPHALDENLWLLLTLNP